MPLESIIEFITTLISDYLYLGVFLAALIETIIPPIPTMAVFPTAGFIASQNGINPYELILLGIVGGLGATIGSTVIYLIALKLGRVECWFQKYGDKAVLFGRMIPVFREMVSIPAGLLKMKLPKFLAYTILGSCGWSMTLIFIGYYFGIAALELW